MKPPGRSSNISTSPTSCPKNALVTWTSPYSSAETASPFIGQHDEEKPDDLHVVADKSDAEKDRLPVLSAKKAPSLREKHLQQEREAVSKRKDALLKQQQVRQAAEAKKEREVLAVFGIIARP